MELLDVCANCHQVTFDTHLYVCGNCGKILCEKCIKSFDDGLIIDKSKCPFCVESKIQSLNIKGF